MAGWRAVWVRQIGTWRLALRSPLVGITGYAGSTNIQNVVQIHALYQGPVTSKVGGAAASNQRDQCLAFSFPVLRVLRSRYCRVALIEAPSSKVAQGTCIIPGGSRGVESSVRIIPGSRRRVCHSMNNILIIHCHAVVLWLSSGVPSPSKQVAKPCSCRAQLRHTRAVHGEQ